VKEINFSGGTGKVLNAWYAAFCGEESSFYLDVGEKSALRRAHDVNQVLTTRAYSSLARALRIPEEDEQSHRHLGNVVFALSGGWPLSEERLGRLMAGLQQGRVMRIIRTRKRETASYYVRGVLSQLQKAPVQDVATLVYWWSKSTQQRLARDYFYSLEGDTKS
jgi:hypothetical protein